jgi:hypothetical protein
MRGKSRTVRPSRAVLADFPYYNIIHTKEVQMSEMAWMHSARIVVEEHSAKWVHPYTGAILDVPDENDLPKFSDDQGVSYPAVLLDMQTAAMLDQVWRNLSPANQAEYANYGLAGAVELGWQIIDKAQKREQ